MVVASTTSVLSKIQTKVKKTLSAVTVEPLMLLDGLAFSNMNVYIENLHVDRVCRVTVGYSKEVCAHLNTQHDASVLVQQKYSVFALYNGIIAAALPLFFILFMGAWSDKYGRKVPLVAVQLGHVLHAAGYILASLEPSWPAEFLLLVTMLDTIGGGAVSFLTAANSYITDVSSEASRTSRVGLANSIWFLGGPAGTILGTFIYNKGGYLPLFATSLCFSLMALIYVIFCLPESHGPFAQKTDFKKSGLENETFQDITVKHQEITYRIMIRDFFSLQRIQDSFTSTLRKREGNTRALMLLLILTSLLRRLTRSPYVFAFTRHVLGWKATDYSIWVTYKNLVATTGSLVAVPLLSGRFGMSDKILAMVGGMSGIVEYVVYGFVSGKQSSLIWAAPVAALLLNSCNIAQRSMMTKFVGKNEIGKVSAVLGALDGMMPMLNSALYTAVYHASVRAFPSAHFFVGAAISALMIVIFCIIIKADKSGTHDIDKSKATLESLLSGETQVNKNPNDPLTSTKLICMKTTPVQEMSNQSPMFSVKNEMISKPSKLESQSFVKRISNSLKNSVRKFLIRRESSVGIPSLEKRPSISSLFVNLNKLSIGTKIPNLNENLEHYITSSQNLLDGSKAKHEV